MRTPTRESASVLRSALRTRTSVPLGDVVRSRSPGPGPATRFHPRLRTAGILAVLLLQVQAGTAWAETVSLTPPYAESSTHRDCSFSGPLPLEPCVAEATADHPIGGLSFFNAATAVRIAGIGGHAHAPGGIAETHTLDAGSNAIDYTENLDPTFDTDGKVTTDFAGHPVAVAIQGDGKIVAAGFALSSNLTYRFVLARYNADGSLDPAFGGDGWVTTDFPNHAIVLDVAIQGDGKIVAAGVAAGNDFFGTENFALARYNADGSLDNSFGGDGKVTTGFAGEHDAAQAVAIQGDGKIVAAGYAGVSFELRPIFGGDDFGLARYNTDGSLDSTFDGDGKVTTDFAGEIDYAWDVAIQDGKIVAAGYAGVVSGGSDDFALARYNNADGLLDPTFGVAGKVTTDFAGGNDLARAVAIQGDGKIVAAGYAGVVSGGSDDFALARYNTDGFLDPTFGGDGKVTTEFDGGTDQSNAVTVQGDGKIVAAGGGGGFGNLEDFALARYNADGLLDPTFGGGGRVTTDFAGDPDQAYGVAIQDGKIVAAGSVSGDFGLARYNADGSLDTTLSGDGKVTTDFPGEYDAAYAMAIQGDGKIVAAGFAGYDLVSGWDFALARYNADGTLDPTFGGDGKVTTDFAGGTDAAYAVAIQGDGKIVAAGCTNNNCGDFSDFALARYNADGSLDNTFSGDGRVTTNFAEPGFAGGRDIVSDVAIQGDGKIVATGCTACAKVNSDFALARYNADGSLDSTFDGDGKVTTDFNASTDVASAVAIQEDGKIVAAGYDLVSGNYDFALARYNADGSLDNTFGGDGKVTTDFATSDGAANGVAIQEDGKIVAAGSALVSGNYDFALARYNGDGSLDATFDGDGKVTTDFNASTDAASAVAIQGNGKIVATGCTACAKVNSDFALARYNADGLLDPTFGVAGKVTTDFAGGNDVAWDVAIQGDGKIVATGWALVSGNYDFALARYRVDSEADLSITKTGPSGRVPTGRNMTYTLTVTNNGPDSASGVTVTDQLPSTVTFVSATATQGSCGESTGTVSCTLGEMSSGAIVTIEIVVRPTTAGTITNLASVASPTPDSNQANNADSVNTSICRKTTRRTTIPCG